MPPISTGDLITAVQFNELVTSYNKLWGDNVVSALFTDITTNFAEHSHGWGQAIAEPTVAITDIITTEHTNQLLSQMNAGLYHYNETSGLIPHFSTTIINASYITSTIEDKITDMSSLARTIVEFIATANQATKTGLTYPLGNIDFYLNGEKMLIGTDFTATDGTSVTFTPALELDAKVKLIMGYSRFDALDDDFSRTTRVTGEDINGVLSTDTATPTWTSTVHSIGIAEFTNYNEARYFFNSGGKLSITLDSDVDNTDPRSWDGIFGTTGAINVRAVDTVNDGSNVVAVTKGFYDITPNGVYTEVFLVRGFAASGDYAYNAYANRSIKISLKASEVTVGGTFNVYIKVELIDDVTSGTISAELTCDYGYVNQTTTPVLLGDSNDAPFTAGAHVYQFITRTIPTLTVDTSWTI
jgi:hypothetical protein